MGNGSRGVVLFTGANGFGDGVNVWAGTACDLAVSVGGGKEFVNGLDATKAL